MAAKIFFCLESCYLGRKKAGLFNKTASTFIQSMTMPVDSLFLPFLAEVKFAVLCVLSWHSAICCRVLQLRVTVIMPCERANTNTEAETKLFSGFAIKKIYLNSKMNNQSIRINCSANQ